MKRRAAIPTEAQGVHEDVPHDVPFLLDVGERGGKSGPAHVSGNSGILRVRHSGGVDCAEYLIVLSYLQLERGLIFQVCYSALRQGLVISANLFTSL